MITHNSKSPGLSWGSGSFSTSVMAPSQFVPCSTPASARDCVKTILTHHRSPTTTHQTRFKPHLDSHLVTSQGCGPTAPSFHTAWRLVGQPFQKRSLHLGGTSAGAFKCSGAGRDSISSIISKSDCCHFSLSRLIFPDVIASATNARICLWLIRLILDLE